MHDPRHLATRGRPRRPAWHAGLLALLGGIPPGVAGAQAPEPDLHSAKAALRLVFRNGALPLPDTPSCRGVDTTGLANPTLGDWLAGILAELPPAPGTSGITAGCEGGADGLRCRVHVSRASGEEVWTWGVRFTADGRTGMIEPASIVCDSSG